MGTIGQEQPITEDESTRAHCEEVERLLVSALHAVDWRLSNRPCVVNLGQTMYQHRVGVSYTPKQRRSRVRARVYEVGPFLDRFVYRTVMMRKRPGGLEDYQFWLLVLSHELMHVIGMVRGTFRWGTVYETGTAWFQGPRTRGTTSSDSEERIAELGSEHLAAWLGISAYDPTWRDTLGDPTLDECREVDDRVAFVIGLLTSVK